MILLLLSSYCVVSISLTSACLSESSREVSGFTPTVTPIRVFRGYAGVIVATLLYIGVGMIVDAVRGGEKKEEELGRGTLLLQGVATSIDALSVGFTIEHYPFSAALAEALIIGAVTFVICLFGLFLGRRAGEKLAGIAPLVGGIILIGIGIEIFITGVF